MNNQHPSDSVEDSFFQFDRGTTVAEVKTLNYLQDPCYQIKCLEKYPTVKRVVIQYNTTLPSFAPVERLFSFAKKRIDYQMLIRKTIIVEG